MKISILCIAALIFNAEVSGAQSAVDLGDVTINGELLNDNRLRIKAREPGSMEDRVKYRKHFKKEILDGYDTNLKTEASKNPN